jgi:hypothetical protein
MDQSGLSECLQSDALQTEGENAHRAALLRVRVEYLSSPIEGELNRQLCEALMALGAPSVAVVSEGPIRRRLRSIPQVKDAIREAWLFLEGLRRQVEAASRGEAMPTWPVYVLFDGGAPV